jgi:hypothetical protein
MKAHFCTSLSLAAITATLAALTSARAANSPVVSWSVACTDSSGDEICTDVQMPDFQADTATFALPALQPAMGDAARIQFSGFVEAEGRWFPHNSDDGVIRKLFGSLALESRLSFDQVCT